MVAEGIDTRHQLEALAVLDCDQGQGSRSPARCRRIPLSSGWLRASSGADSVYTSSSELVEPLGDGAPDRPADSGSYGQPNETAYYTEGELRRPDQ